MCGIVGIAGHLEYKDEQTMKRLLLLDYFRGPDSTGFASVRMNGDVKIAKISSNPLDLFEMPKFKEALNGSQSKAFIGHNRAATRGGITTFNAHPFQYDHIVGVHNGTLTYSSTARLEEALGEKFTVDSQAMIAAIAKLGIKKTIELCETGADSQTGAWSLVWHDQDDGTLNFLRNKHRPMWYGYSEDFKHLFYASEWQMIQAAVDMSVTPYKMYSEPKTRYKYWSTEEDVHLKFDLALLDAGGEKRPKPKAVLLPGREPTPAVTTGGLDPFQRIGGKTTGFHTIPPSTRSSTPSTTNHGPVTKGSRKDVINLFGDMTNPLAGFMDAEDFDMVARCGCQWCDGEIRYGEAGITFYERDAIIVCPSCSGHDTPLSANEETLPPTRLVVRGRIIDNLS